MSGDCDARFKASLVVHKHPWPGHGLTKIDHHHICELPADHFPGSEHRCACSAKWVSAHPYVRDRHSGAGNCWCGRPQSSPLHTSAKALEVLFGLDAAGAS